MKLQVLKRFVAIALAGVMSFSVAFSGNLTVSAEDVQNGTVTGTSGEDDGQVPENGEEDEEGIGQTPGDGSEGEEGEDQTPGGTEGEDQTPGSGTEGEDGEEDGEDAGQTPGSGSEGEEEGDQAPAAPIQDGWFKAGENWYLYQDGQMLTGWQWDGGSCYYMYDNGIMAADTWIDNYYVNASGAWVPSYEPPHWILSSAGWWYRNADGSYPAGAWQLIDNQWYYFNSAGYMVTGWQLLGNTWYYLSGSGAMLTGWQYLGGVWYYLDASGAMQTGWLLDGETWYYLSGSGAMQTGWQLLGNTWYYLNASGAMLTGKQDIAKQTYFFKDSGAMVTGWNLEDEIWYYYNASGAMQTGWILDGSTWYYCEPKTGVMQTGWITVNKIQYYMDESGAMKTGWYEIDSETGKNWYYFDTSGAMLKSRWVGKYYVLSDGKMAVSQYIGDYYVGEDGKWVETTGGDKVYVVELADGKTTTVIGQYDEAASQEVFTLLNKYRLENGCDPLKRTDTTLQTAAETRGYELAKANNPVRPNGELYTSLYGNSDDACGQNIAGASGMTAEGAMSVWKASEPDKVNMLNKTATSVGIAAFKATNNITYYVMLFSF